MVGGAIVSMPNAFYHTGLITGTLFTALMGVQTTYSASLYLTAMEMLPGQPESLFEIGFVLFNRRSIFLISTIIIFNSFGLMLIYFILFGDTISGLVIIFTGLGSDSVWAHRATYVIIITVLLLPLALKKHLEELTIVSLLLFLSLVTFIGMNYY